MSRPTASHMRSEGRPMLIAGVIAALHRPRDPRLPRCRGSPTTPAAAPTRASRPAPEPARRLRGRSAACSRNRSGPPRRAADKSHSAGKKARSKSPLWIMPPCPERSGRPPSRTSAAISAARTSSRAALEGEGVLLEHVPRDARRILDLGTGDGRLLALLRADRPGDARASGSTSRSSCSASARERFAGDERVELVEHDLTEPLPALGRFDAVVSSLAIHHLEHERKRSLYAEVFDLLEPGGVFANFEHVASPSRPPARSPSSPRSTSRSSTRIPSDRLLDVETPARAGCARSASTTSTATGSGSRWRCSSGSGRPRAGR